MNIPLDRLYQFIENIAETIYGNHVIIYRFFPHGSKNIQDLNQIRNHDWIENSIHPNVWCHDQEPLDFEYYRQGLRVVDNEFTRRLIEIMGRITFKNLNHASTMFSKAILLHSEKRSDEVKKYDQDNELVPVYYWSHAIIARDWFRYAEHVKQRKKVRQPFLIYSRAWSGTREYRLRFAELLIQLNLQDHCKTSVNPIEPELNIHYSQHTFKNPIWRPSTVLENFFPISDAHSHYSADFDIEDYEATDIEIVLETLFDDERLHITEKSLRPIACGQPFILAGTHGSLEYLRSYGFKTFGDVWDESYDSVKNPAERLIQIAELMKQIAGWTTQIREQRLAQAQAIAEHNRQYFFSQEFFDRVINELKTNLQTGFSILNNLPVNSDWIEVMNTILDSQELRQLLDGMENTDGFTISNIEKLLGSIATSTWR
jgi:hypothetical protein